MASDSARGRPFHSPHLGGDAAADAVLPRQGAAAGAAYHDRAEVLPHARHRRGRAGRPPPHVLRDARKLLVRAVLQGRRDRAGGRVRSRASPDRVGTDLGHGARRRPGARAGRGRDRYQAVAGDRVAAPPDRGAAELGELLVGRRAGALRARLRDLLRLGRGVRMRRPRLCARLPALRPIPRVLEPRLHGVRAARGPDSDAAPDAERRYRPGRRASGRDHARRPVRLRDGRLPGDHGLDRGGERGCLGRRRDRDEGAPGARRPRPRDDLSRRRRCRALERGSRLRAAPDRPPCRPAGAQDRPRRPMAAVGRGGRADGPVVPRAGAEPRPHRGGPPRRGGALLRDALARDAASSRRSRRRAPSRPRTPLR